jgi:hypothetical protein
MTAHLDKYDPSQKAESVSKRFDTAGEGGAACTGTVSTFRGTPIAPRPGNAILAAYRAAAKGLLRTPNPG